MTDKAKKIAELNDLLRMGEGPALGHTMLTEGITGLDVLVQFEIMHRVIQFDDFSENNDPHAERDFGAFEHKGHKVFWKIDYYDKSLTAGSEDPSDPAKTTRVLTIMLAQEY